MYLNHLQAGIRAVENLTISNLASFVAGSSSQPAPALTLSPQVLKNLTASGARVPVVLFNTLGWPVKKFVSVPIFALDIVVTDTLGNIIPSDVISAAPQFTVTSCQVQPWLSNAVSSTHFYLYLLLTTCGLF